jgi:RNA polymerase sigma-70 factor (ECF subfamily)
MRGSARTRLPSTHFAPAVHPCSVNVGPRSVGRKHPPATAGPAGSAGVPPRGLSASFEDFYEIEHEGLFSALCLITGNRHDAEELMQEAFLKVWERWDVVQGLENPAGYVYRTAMNAFRMRYRRAKMALRKLPRASQRTGDLEVFEARASLDRGMSTLTPRQRAALVLTELLEFSSDEAGRCMGITPATVRKLASQARERLRRSMGTDDE